MVNWINIHQDKNKPFQPFAIFEDDVKKFDEFPIEIEIPNDTIFYILDEIFWNTSQHGVQLFAVEISTIILLGFIICLHFMEL